MPLRKSQSPACFFVKSNFPNLRKSDAEFSFVQQHVRDTVVFKLDDVLVLSLVKMSHSTPSLTLYDFINYAAKVAAVNSQSCECVV
jgi:hypothetical protein